MPGSIISRIPIRLSVPALLVVPVLLVALILSMIAYLNGRTTARDLVSQELAQIHDRIESHVSELLSAPARINALNASLIEQGKLDPADLASWRDTLIAQMHAFDMLSTVAWGDVEGRAIWVCRYVGDNEHTYFAIKEEPGRGPMPEYRVGADGAVEPEPSSVFDFDPRVRPWYLAPVEAGGPAWCEPFVWVGGGDAAEATLGLSYGQPFTDASGLVRGVIDADLSLLDISKYLSRLRIGERGGAFLVDGQGLIIASSIAVRTADVQARRIAARDSEQPWLAAAAAAIETTFGSFEDLREPLRRTVTVGGERLLLVAAPLEHDTGQRWNILTLVPEADFLASVYATRRRSLFISVAIAGLTVLVGIVIATLMIRPMLSLTAHVRHIGEGDLDNEIHLAQSPELVRLSNEINEMTAGLRDRMRMRHSLAVAMDVQQALLPSESPSVEGIDVAGHSTYCDETGGDYFDFLEISGVDNRAVVVALGDVMGHGVAAAMLMATARGILRSRCQESGSLADLLEHMNTLLVPDTDGKRFMTMLLCTIDARTKSLRWASAGHDPPFLYDPSSKEHIELDGAGLPLGIMDGEQYEEYAHTGLRPGQILFLATDGVWEMQNAATEQFGKQRVRDLLAQFADQPAEVIGQEIREALAAHRGDESQDDDVTFVVVRVL